MSSEIKLLITLAVALMSAITASAISGIST